PLAQARRGPRHPSAVGRGHRPAAGVNSGPPRARTSWSGGRDRQLHTRGHGAIGSAPALQAGGYGFESRWLHNFRRTRTPDIGGSWCWCEGGEVRGAQLVALVVKPLALLGQFGQFLGTGGGTLIECDLLRRPRPRIRRPTGSSTTPWPASRCSSVVTRWRCSVGGRLRRWCRSPRPPRARTDFARAQRAPLRQALSRRRHVARRRA